MKKFCPYTKDCEYKWKAGLIRCVFGIHIKCREFKRRNDLEEKIRKYNPLIDE